MRNCLVFILLSLTMCLEAQQKDTLSIMCYNLLYYRNTTSFCTMSNNNPSDKDRAMRTIIGHALPDILVVNEMGGNSRLNTSLLVTGALNRGGRTYYSASDPKGLGQSLINALYYDNRKLVLESQSTITKDLNNNDLVRLIDVFTLRYKDSNLAVHKDTIRLHILAAHLKAGSSSSDQDERAAATEAVMAHLDSINATGNYFFAGDFNISSSTEEAYKDLTKYVDTSLRFFDPINMPGNWKNSAAFSSIHTQSTHTGGGCFSGGGMDDRFDFILASGEVMNNTDRVKYIRNSYEALGQDGNRFNGSITSPTNNSIPSSVAQALFDMSDHLPVVLDVELSLPVITSAQDENGNLLTKKRFIISNPAREELKIDLSASLERVQGIQLIDMNGRVIKEFNLLNSHTPSIFAIDIASINKGLYLLRINGAEGNSAFERFVKY